jgi:hypothetical protein
MFGGAEELRQQQARSNLSRWSLKAKHPDLPRRGLSAFARDGRLALSQVKVASERSNGQVRFFQWKAGVSPALHAMFEDNDEDYYINTQGFKAFEYLFADLPSWFYTRVRDLVLSLCQYFGLIVQRVAYAGHPGVSSPESYNGRFETHFTTEPEGWANGSNRNSIRFVYSPLLYDSKLVSYQGLCFHSVLCLLLLRIIVPPVG